MADTFQALAVFGIGILPGGAYVWAFERQAGAWAPWYSDRLLRIVGISAAVHILAAPLSYWLWSSFVEPGRLARAEPVSWFLWLVPIAYVGLPWAIGTYLGRAAKEQRWPWSRLTRIAPNRSPRAWDHLFARELSGYVRVKLKGGGWVAGAYAAETAGGPPSLASRYPEPGDLWLARQLEIDDDGRLARGPDGLQVLKPGGVLVRWDEMDYLEFAPDQAGGM